MATLTWIFGSCENKHQMLTWSLILWTNIRTHTRATLEYWRFSIVGISNRTGHQSPLGGQYRGKIEQKKINITLKPEYPWTIIIIGGETGRQMVRTMQITAVACAPLVHVPIRLPTLVRGIARAPIRLPTLAHVPIRLPTLVRASTYSEHGGYFRFWGNYGWGSEKPAVVTCAMLHSVTLARDLKPAQTYFPVLPALYSVTSVTSVTQCDNVMRSQTSPNIFTINYPSSAEVQRSSSSRAKPVTEALACNPKPARIVILQSSVLSLSIHK